MNKAATPETAAPTAVEHQAAAAPKPLIQEEWRAFVEEMLVAGLAVEEIVEAVAARGGPDIKAGAILAHYRTHPELQKRRVEQTVSGVAKLREALGKPESDKELTELAGSALMVGYLGLTQKSAHSITMKDAEMIRLSGENLKLRKRYMELKEQGQKRENKLLYKRLRYEDVKYETACVKLKQLRKSLRTLIEEGKLEPSTIEKIKEIYGIIRQPFIEENSKPPLQG